jgi:hypothetical protein
MQNRKPLASGFSQTQTTLFPGVWLALFAFAVYLANGRPGGAGDTTPMTLLPLAILRGDGPFLDHYSSLFDEMVRATGLDPARDRPYFIAQSHGHIVSPYPIGAVAIYLPLVAPQVWLLDLTRPGWDTNPVWAYNYACIMTKLATAGVAALVVALTTWLIGRLGMDRDAPWAGLALALGSPLWAIASQRAWQHGPAALALVAALLALARPITRGHLLLAGLWSALLVAIRPVDIAFAAALAFWVLWYHPRWIAWFLPAPVALAAALLAYNVYFFGWVTGGQTYELAADTRDLFTGLAGTLISPSRGLFIFCPWVALVLVLLPWTVQKLPPGSVARWCLAAILPFGLLIGAWRVWWGGHCYGPRFWTEAMPLFAVALAAALEWVRNRRPPVRHLFAAVFSLAISWSITGQALGAWCHPSGWESIPNDIDRHPERLWDWHDSEITRCLGMSPHGTAVASPRSPQRSE